MSQPLLAQSMGVLRQPLTEEEREYLPALVSWAGRFLRAGGTVTLTEWSALTRLEVMALIQAGDELETERGRLGAAMTGVAATGPLGVAKVLAPIDGGQAGANVLAKVGLEALRRTSAAPRP